MKHYFFCGINLIKKNILVTYNSLCVIIKRIGTILYTLYLLYHKKPLTSDDIYRIKTSHFQRKSEEEAIEGFFYESNSVDLSIIIPTYNSSFYIRECLDSILLQDTKYKYEIIVIDDGSCDETISILSEYFRDGSIHLLTQNNSGQSAARNKGIFYSRGAYLMFVDSDDVLLPGALEKMLYKALSTDSDIVEGSFVRFIDSISPEMIKDSEGKNSSASTKNNPSFVLTTYGYSWAKVYKRDLWATLRFPQGFIFEDIVTKFILRRKANRVIFLKDVVYGYRQNNHSTSHGNNYLKKLDSIRILPIIINLCKKENMPQDKVFYLLLLNHISLLNYNTVRPFNRSVRLYYFQVIADQLWFVQQWRPARVPLVFHILEKTILQRNFTAWEYLAERIGKYTMLKRFREIN